MPAKPNPSSDAKILIAAYMKLGLVHLDAAAWALKDYKDLLENARLARRLMKKPDDIVEANRKVSRFLAIVEEVERLHERLVNKYY